MPPTLSRLRSCSPSLLGQAAGLVALLFLAACDEEKPYTPFGVASSVAPEPQPPEPSATKSVPIPPPAQVHAKRLKKPLREWRVGEATIRAPAGRLLSLLIEADLDGDAQQDLVAWTVKESDMSGTPQPRSAFSGELWALPAAGKAERLTASPTFLPRKRTCSEHASLSKTGPNSVTLDVRSMCTHEVPDRAPIRSLQVFNISRRVPLLTLRISEPALGEHFEFRIQSHDLDGDGQDDVTMGVRLESDAPTPGDANAQMIWLDRPAGSSRDTNEPGRSFASQASRLVGQARKAPSNNTLSLQFGNLRRLYSSLCAESGTARVFDAAGSPLPCHSLNVTFTRLITAEVEAALRAGDPYAAIVALQRNTWSGNPIKARQLKELETKVLRGVPSVRINRAQLLSLSPLPRSRKRPATQVRLSPLRFETNGALLIQERHRVMRRTPYGKLLAAPEIRPWSLRVADPRGERIWTRVQLSCDRPEFALQMTDTLGIPSEPLSTPILAPRPGPCAGGPTPPLAAPVPLGWSHVALRALVAGEFVAIGPASETSPRSSIDATGSWTVSTNLGLWHQHVRRELWQLSDALKKQFGRWDELTDCTYSASSQSTACIWRDRVVFLEHPDKPRPNSGDPLPIDANDSPSSRGPVAP